MAVPAHWRCTFLGHFGPTANSAFEQWTCSINFGAPDGSGTGTMPKAGLASFSNLPSEDYTEAADALAEDFRLTWIKPAMKSSAGVWFDGVKLALIGPDGLYQADAWEGVSTYGPTQGGNSGASVFPPQVAMAVTLRTGQRGATRRGRFFLPAPSVSIARDGNVDAAVAVPMAGALRDLVADLNNWGGIDAGTSAVAVIASSKGYLTPVTRVELGSRLDTIRSRAGKIQETYSGADL